MTNIELMEKALPTAPLKIAALESCKDLAEKVDQIRQYLHLMTQTTTIP